MWLTDKDKPKLIKMFSVCLSYLLGYQCANNWDRFSLQRWVRWEKFNVFYLRNTKNLSTLKRQMIRERTNGNFRNCTHPSFTGNSEINGCKWPYRFCFLSKRKARWLPLLKYLKKRNSFAGYEKIEYYWYVYYISNSVFKRNSHLCWPNAEFHYLWW